MPPPRPEAENPADVFYNAAGAARYARSTRIQVIQREMTQRALELLDLPAGRAALVLDVGCGSGLSGEVLRANGHAWVGVDLSADMLAIAKADDGAEEPNAELAPSGGPPPTRVDLRHVRWGLIHESDESDESDESAASVVPGPAMAEVLRGDMGEGLPFRPGSFDGAVSISAVQWLCQSDHSGHVPQRRLRALFQCLYNALRRGAKAVLQFYPSGVEQVHMITNAAMRCGFTGGIVVDFPHSAKAKKHYLVLQAGQVAGGFVPPAPLGQTHPNKRDSNEEVDEEEEEEEEEEEDEEEEEERTRIQVGGRTHGKRFRSHSDGRGSKRRRKDNRPVTGSKDWVLLKKSERRKFGLKTTEDSKYTMRKRRPRF